jgi:hypothetical protein
MLAVVCGAAAAALAAYGGASLPAGGPFEALRGALAGGGGTVLIAASAGLGLFLVAGFLAPGIADAAALGRLAGKLRQIAIPAKPDALLAAFAGSPVATEGKAYAASLWPPRSSLGDPSLALRSAIDPDEALAPARRMREAAGTLFSHLALALLALGIALLWLDPSGAAPRPLPLGVAAGGLASILLVRLLTYCRIEQLAEIAEAMRRLFPADKGEAFLDRVAALLSADGEARDAAIAAASGAVASRLDAASRELKKALETSDQGLAERIAAAVRGATQPIATTIIETAKHLEAADAEHAAQLLEAVLADFLRRFEERFGTQAAEIGDMLVKAREASEALQRSFAQSQERLLGDAQQLSGTIERTLAEALERGAREQAEALREAIRQLSETVASTGAKLAELTAASEAARESWSARSGEIASAIVARAGEEMKRTAAAFAQVHAVLESLSLSALPAINKLATTQERLHGAVEASRGTGQTVAEAARDLAEAGRVSRDLVERQILLIKELSQLAHGAPAAPAAAPPAAGLARALEDLRAEADDELRSLPSL